MKYCVFLMSLLMICALPLKASHKADSEEDARRQALVAELAASDRFVTDVYPLEAPCQALLLAADVTKVGLIVQHRTALFSTYPRRLAAQRSPRSQVQSLPLQDYLEGLLQMNPEQLVAFINSLSILENIDRYNRPAVFWKAPDFTPLMPLLAKLSAEQITQRTDAIWAHIQTLSYAEGIGLKVSRMPQLTAWFQMTNEDFNKSMEALKLDHLSSPR